MALNYGSVYPLFLKELPVNALTGVSAPLLASGLTTGISNYLLSGITIQTFDSGTVVPGTPGAGTGTISLNPLNLFAELIKEFPANLIAGISVLPISNAISMATSNSLSLASVSSIHPSVTAGTGAGSAVPSAAYPYISLGLKSVAFTGVLAESFSLAVARALESSLSSSVVNVVIAGPPSTTPGTGIGTGRLT